MADGDSKRDSDKRPEDTSEVSSDNGIRIKRARATAEAEKRAEGKTPTRDRPLPSVSDAVSDALSSPDRAIEEKRIRRAKVSKGLTEDDRRRMSSARALSGEIREGITALCRQIVPVVFGDTVDSVSLDAAINAVLTERVVAGLYVSEGKGGPLLKARRLQRPQAIAYALGGEVQSLYESIAALQVNYPLIYSVVMLVVNTVAIAKGVAKHAESVSKATVAAREAAAAQAEAAKGGNSAN